MLFSSSNSVLRRIILSVAILTLLTLGVVVQAQDADISGTLDVQGFGGETGDEIATTRVAHFKELYPDVTVNFTEGALDEQQFLTSVASGNPPDLVSLNRVQIGTYATRGALMPLTECIESHGIDMSQYRQTAVDEVTVNGEVYGIPEFFNNLMLIVNTKALEDAGMTLEDIDTSDWESIRQLSQALTVGSGDEITRIGFDPKLPEFLPLWVQANGGQMISDDGRTAMLNSP